MSQNMNMHTVFKTKSFIFGSVAFLIVSVIGSIVYSFMLLKDSVADSSALNAAIIILGLSALVSGITSGISNKNKGIHIGLLCAAIQIVLLLLISIVFREKTPFFCAENWIKFTVITLGNAIGGIIGVNIKKKY